MFYNNSLMFINIYNIDRLDIHFFLMINIKVWTNFLSAYDLWPHSFNLNYKFLGLHFPARRSSTLAVPNIPQWRYFYFPVSTWVSFLLLNWLNWLNSIIYVTKSKHNFIQDISIFWCFDSLHWGFIATLMHARVCWLMIYDYTLLPQ
jgi:hypothetical protein